MFKNVLSRTRVTQMKFEGSGLVWMRACATVPTPKQVRARTRSAYMCTLQSRSYRSKGEMLNLKGHGGWTQVGGCFVYSVCGRLL